MNHNENSLIKKYPIINKFLGVITAILVTYFVLEWKDITKSYWGFVYLIIALPGLFLPIINLFNRKKKKMDKKPPTNGEVIIKVEETPVSVNSKKEEKKSELNTFIKNIISIADYFLSGDIQIEIEWYISEQLRYESATVLDVDNIIKFLLDAISGVDGIVIDDNQVKFVSCRWLDLNPNELQYLIIRIKFTPDEYIDKQGLYFVEHDKGFCFPIWDNEPTEIQKMRIETNEKLIKYRYELEVKGFSYSQAKLMMPMQRVFHKRRLKNFKIITLEEIKKSLY